MNVDATNVDTLPDQVVSLVVDVVKHPQRSGSLTRSTTSPPTSPVIQASQVLQHHSRSFSLAVRFLPARLRGNVTALYAWCRSVDDAVDQVSDPKLAEKTLDVLEEDLQRCVAGESTQHPASAWIQPLLTQRQIEARHAQELIEGMRMDLRYARVDNDAELERYCYHAAGTVGLMMTRLMGVRDRRVDHYAESLGIAMQLTNIARDVLEDAQRGRSYLPGIPDPLTSDPASVKEAVMHLLNTAEQRYCTAAKGLKYLPRDCRLGIRLALAFYREIGRQIRRNNYAVLQQRTTVNKSRLLFAGAKASLAWLAEEVQILFTESKSSITQQFKEWTMNVRNTSHELGLPAVPAPVSTYRQAKQLVYLGLSLTLIMATALFAMVFIHPKSVDYSVLPLIYAGACLCGSVLFHRLSARCDALPAGLADESIQ